MSFLRVSKRKMNEMVLIHVLKCYYVDIVNKTWFVSSFFFLARYKFNLPQC